ncbi:hypothetical protein [Streptomyces lasiicapitis]|uniref:Uncharacterized protein n=1 Tax=Streptomyces lasiicapitis TaxID=1923961 RepID=A0ABQ2MQ12_9ACTN|nr:hypothetical protein [Streptomyces lasiicapitis]GGO55844.1 hypothetical protein GCM10012286_68920 [Streptomyces lasiicapitis]
MSAIRQQRWRLVAVLLCVLGSVAASLSAVFFARSWSAVSIALGCFLIAWYLRTQTPAPPANGPDSDGTGGAA